MQNLFELGKQKDGYLFDNLKNFSTYLKNSVLNPTINYQISKHANSDEFIYKDIREKIAKAEIEEEHAIEKQEKVYRNKEALKQYKHREQPDVEEPDKEYKAGKKEEPIDENRHFAGTNGNDTYHGGSGNDNIHGQKGTDSLYGEAGNDKIYGENGNDKIYGGVGNDTINGGKGNDELYGGEGSDFIKGDVGDDKIYGGEGNDILKGDDGDDTIYGGAGNDIVYAGRDKDTIYAGEGNDTLVGGNGSDTVVFSGNLSDYTFCKNGNKIIVTDIRAGSPDGVDTITEVEKFKFVDGTIPSSSVTFLSTPLVLDLDNDGIETLSFLNGVTFDIDADGDGDITGWVGSDDAFLVRDINKDSIINDASELFGQETLKEDGTTASNGFEALAQLDSNNDGLINSKDDAFDELQVWKDSNSNGITEEGELLSLYEAGVAEISLESKESSAVDNNNLLSLEGTYTNTEGQKQNITDVWFSYEENNQEQTIDLSSNNINTKTRYIENDSIEINFEEFILINEDANEYIFLEEETTYIQEVNEVFYNKEENLSFDSYQDSNSLSYVNIIMNEIDIQDI